MYIVYVVAYLFVGYLCALLFIHKIFPSQKFGLGYMPRVDVGDAISLMVFWPFLLLVIGVIGICIVVEKNTRGLFRKMFFLDY